MEQYGGYSMKVCLRASWLCSFVCDNKLPKVSRASKLATIDSVIAYEAIPDSQWPSRCARRRIELKFSVILWSLCGKCRLWAAVWQMPQLRDPAGIGLVDGRTSLGWKTEQ